MARAVVAETPIFEDRDSEMEEGPEMQFFVKRSEFEADVQKWKKVSNFVLFVT